MIFQFAAHVAALERERAAVIFTARRGRGDESREIGLTGGGGVQNTTNFPMGLSWSICVE